jgi:tetraacyldisaccharide-1-P 4'-kinase
VIASFVQHVWSDPGAAARGVRAVLWPLEAVYRSTVAVRATMYDRHILRSHALALPALSVGNKLKEPQGRRVRSADGDVRDIRSR